MRIIHVMLSLVFLLSGVAVVQACETPEMTADIISKRFPDAPIVNLSRDQAQRFLAAFNDFEPPPNYTGSEIVLVIRKGMPRAYLAIYENGCAKHKGYISAGLAKRMLKISRGTQA